MSNKLMILGVFLIFASAPAVADRAADEAAIREATKQFNTALNRNDTKAIEALLDENLENWKGDLKGPAALVRAIKDNPDTTVRFLEEVGIVFLTPDVAVHKFYEENSGWRDGDGNPSPPAKALRAYVYAKKNGKWLRGAMFLREVEE